MGTIRQGYKYEGHILKLQDLEGFYEKWLDMVADCGTSEKAYDALERLYTYYYGDRKYKNYETFRSTVYRWRKNVNTNR